MKAAFCNCGLERVLGCLPTLPVAGNCESAPIPGVASNGLDRLANRTFIDQDIGCVRQRETQHLTPALLAGWPVVGFGVVRHRPSARIKIPCRQNSSYANSLVIGQVAESVRKLVQRNPPTGQDSCDKGRAASRPHGFCVFEFLEERLISPLAFAGGRQPATSQPRGRCHGAHFQARRLDHLSYECDALAARCDGVLWRQPFQPMPWRCGWWYSGQLGQC